MISPRRKMVKQHYGQMAPVTEQFLQAIATDLDYLEENEAPPPLWRMVKVITGQAADEVAWMQEIRKQAFTD